MDLHLPTHPPPRQVTCCQHRREWMHRAAVALLAAALAGCGQTEASTDAVSLETVRAEHEAGRAVLIDIREPEEHATGVAAGAKLLLICNTLNPSSATLRALRERGYAHVRYVNGGMSEWARRGCPMVKPPTGPGS